MAFSPSNPPAQVIAACSTVGYCFAAAGFYEGDPAGPTAKTVALWEHMGMESMAPSYYIADGPKQDYEGVIGSWGMDDPDSGLWIEANFGERQKARLARKYARLHHGLPDEYGIQQQQQQQQQQVPQIGDTVLESAREVRNLVQATIVPPDSKVSLKETVSQVSDASAVKLTADEIIACYARWAAI